MRIMLPFYLKIVSPKTFFFCHYLLDPMPMEHWVNVVGQKTFLELYSKTALEHSALQLK